MKQADNLVQRKISKDIRSSSYIQADTKNSLDVKVIGNTIYLDGPVSSAAEKAVIMEIVAKQGPQYKVTDTTVTK
jgi:osmotically-inducible protein OsmY